MTGLLIVNADDYALTEAISRGILRAHRDGVVTSTSVLAVGPALRRTAGWLTAEPALGVGAHLALVGEDPPVLTAAEIPTLVDRRGRFPLSWRAFLVRAATPGRVDPADVEREFTAQLDVLTRDHGLPLTHLDTHQHLHLWPPVAAVLVRLARRHGVGAVRLPSSAATGPKGAGIRLLSRRLAARIREAGLVAPAGYGGLDEAGALTLPRFLATVGRLAASRAASIEINCHPGEADDPDRARYAWDFRWDAELAALTSRELRTAIAGHGLRTGGYADLPG
ncbi:ChbG/HpnK family deacetylase [Amycolatopsis suaedae]|uniref:ChbG/HpnK family deacetylase n=1 Tax=Amycolatopsis suaedae TaxID=2510978 RepID=UPI00196A43A6|nr:ChbG/HpnK family deacetylase [Amycolatopsis suaedae]